MFLAAQDPSAIPPFCDWLERQAQEASPRSSTMCAMQEKFVEAAQYLRFLDSFAVWVSQLSTLVPLGSRKNLRSE